MVKRKAESDPAPDAPLHPTTRTATKWKEGIKETGQCIADEFNKTGLLKHAVKFEVIKEEKKKDNERGNEEETNNLKVKFYLTKDASSAAEYWMKDRAELNARGIGVESNLGSRTGQLLFHLTLLLAILRNTSVFELDNFTNDPVRAAEEGGIYSMFDVDKRIMRHCTSRDEFTGKSLAEQLELAEGGMILKKKKSTYSEWKKNMMKIATKVDCLLDGKSDSSAAAETSADVVGALRDASEWNNVSGPIAKKMKKFFLTIDGFTTGGKTRKKTRKTRKKIRKTRKKTKK